MGQDHGASTHLVRVIPTDYGQFVLELNNGEHRLLKGLVLTRELGWSELANPRKARQRTFSATQLGWPGGRTLGLDYLLAQAQPMNERELGWQSVDFSQCNRAPTPEHDTHHVYYVSLKPFDPQPFGLGESIHGGHGERGGMFSFDLAGLVAWPNWREHFELAGCGWAIALVDANTTDAQALLDVLIDAWCQREA